MMKTWEQFKADTLELILNTPDKQHKYQFDATYHAEIYNIVLIRWDGYKAAFGKYDTLRDIQIVAKIGCWSPEVELLRAALDRVNALCDSLMKPRGPAERRDPNTVQGRLHTAGEVVDLFRAAAAVPPAQAEPEWTPDCRTVTSGDTVADYVRGSRAPREDRIASSRRIPPAQDGQP